MKSFIFLLFFSVANSFAYSQTIADCTNPDGYAYFHYSGVVSKKDAGFQKDKITGGITSIVKLPNGKFDILIVDTRKTIISMTNDGGSVMLLRRGKKDATFLHIYPGKVAELYTLWMDTEGRAKFDLVQSKGGDNMLIHKSSVMVGSCDSINFDLIQN
jgi:hypothetical protein